MQVLKTELLCGCCMIPMGDQEPPRVMYNGAKKEPEGVRLLILEIPYKDGPPGLLRIEYTEEEAPAEE